MKSLRSLVSAAALSGAAVLLLASPASAAGSYDPNVARVANPANACKSIPGSVERAAALFGVPIDTSAFDYDRCVVTLARGDAFVEPAAEYGSPYVQCDRLVAAGYVHYGETLHAGNDLEDQLLPDLTVNNRKECGSALYAYHSIVSYFPQG